jgi:TetR/AcrR family transcriptional repressor of mexJK operon
MSSRTLSATQPIPHTEKLPRKGQRLSSRERIAKVAKNLFVSKGYEGVSVDEIAREANVSKPTIYAHFGSKEALFLSILDAWCATISAPLVGQGASDRPIEEVLRAHARTYTRLIFDPSVLDMNRLLIAEARRVPDTARRYYEVGPNSAYKAIASFLQERISTGEIDCSDCYEAARAYAAILLASTRLRMQLIVDEKPDWDEIDRRSDFVIGIFLDGLRPHGQMR